MKDFFCVVLVLCSSLVMRAQEVVVINNTTGQVIENVAVYNQNYSKSVISNSRGVVDLKTFTDTDSLYFQHPSYERLALSYNFAVSVDKIKLVRKVVLIPEFVISASKYRERKTDISQMIDVISPQKMDRLPYQTSADILQSTGNIFIQKTQGGGGSPILRGFEANKILLVVDGIRMNNAIYRGGHLQNSITIDNAILERVEIIYGPSSVIYGSDALGGTIHYITRTPSFTDEKGKKEFHLNAYEQIATGNKSSKSHVDFSLAGNRIGSLTSFTYSHFGDIRMGSLRSPFLGDEFKMDRYIDRLHRSDPIINLADDTIGYNTYLIDSIVENPNPLIQKYTGYKQYDLLQKFTLKVNDKNTSTINFQYSTSSDVDRYDNLANLKYAEWHYGPQQRLLASFSNNYKASKGIFSEFTTTLAYQKIQESRHTRKFRNDKKISQIEDLNIVCANIDFLKKFDNNSYIHYGIDMQYDHLVSDAHSVNIVTGEKTLDETTRYADNGSNYWNSSLFAAFKTNIGQKLKTSLGVRYNYNGMEFSYEDTKGDLLEDTYFSSINNALTGSFGVVYSATPILRLSSNISTGYRNPNLDDVSKIREKKGYITLPNPNVKPEYTYNGEIGFTLTLDGYIQLNGYYFASSISNIITRVSMADPFIVYQGDTLTPYVNDNTGTGLIHGFNLNIRSDFNSNVSFKGTLNYTSGRNQSTEEPLAHIPPLHGHVGLSYNTKRLQNDIYFKFSGWKKQEHMSSTGEDNEATIYGYPSWYTLNLRTNFKINSNFDLLLACENATDNFYIPFASTVAASGISFNLTLRFHI
ncbi:MAG: TonB-dependent receptor [Bacteroidales bacterium]|nr:TonB-dependent receptor [Bacteroidales bacterium]